MTRVSDRSDVPPRFKATPPAPALPRAAHLLGLAWRAVRAGRAGVGILSPDGQIAESLTLPEDRQDETGLAARLVPLVLQRAIPVRLEDVSVWLADESGPLLGVPWVGATRRGAVYFLRQRGEPPFDEEDVASVAPLAAWLSDEELSREGRLVSQFDLLNRIAHAAAGDLDLARLFRVTLQGLDRYLPRDPCVVWLTEESEEGQPGVCRLTAASPCLPPGTLQPDLCLRWQETPFAACLSEGRAEYADLTGRAPEQATRLEQILAPLHASSTFCVPLKAADRIVGVLQSICLRPRGFTTEQVQFLYRVADLLGPAVSNCRLIEELMRANEGLRLAQHQLVQAEKMRALGEMAGGMAHEFNNSLCGVLGFLDLTLSSRGLDPDNRRHLETARTCAHDAAQVVRRVQDFARQRRAEQVTQPTDLDQLTTQALEMARHRWEVSGITVDVSASSAATVLGAPCELREVITNLVFNAVDAMPRGGTLSVRTWRAGDRACLSVSDTGVGIPDTLREKIFEPFFTTKGEKGNGLGLSVTFAIVRRHSGEISCVSKPGQGTTFEVRLPLHVGRPSKPLCVRPSQFDKSARRKLRILVVEDERGVREFLLQALTGLGHRVRVAVDGNEGVAAIREEAVDVVLTDLGLPGLRGDEVAREVAQRRPGTPVLLLTGWGEQVREGAIDLPGVSRVLAKPISLDVLAAALDEAARGKHAV